MPGLKGININFGKDTASLCTKRTCSDNSEIYITSKLNHLYNQTILRKNTYSSRRALKKMVEGNYLDREA